MRPTTRLREMLASDELLLAPGAYNAFSAKVIAGAGFDLISLTGSGISTTLLGMPDVGFITMTEMAMIAHYVTNAVDVPVICDIDTGYGNAVSVTRTIREFEQAGVAAVHIEDQVAPKRCGHIAGKEVISLEEMVGKIKAATDTRRDPDFVIIARTDARSELGLDEAIRRANAYVEAGADVAFIDAPMSIEELERIPREVNAPVLLNMGGYAAKRTTPRVSLDQVREMGFRLVLFPLAPLRAATWGMIRFLEDFRERGVQAELDFIDEIKGHPINDWYNYVGMPAIRELEERYQDAEEVARRYSRTVGYTPESKAKEDGQK